MVQFVQEGTTYSDTHIKYNIHKIISGKPLVMQMPDITTFTVCRYAFLKFHKNLSKIQILKAYTFLSLRDNKADKKHTHAHMRAHTHIHTGLDFIQNVTKISLNKF